MRNGVERGAQLINLGVTMAALGSPGRTPLRSQSLRLSLLSHVHFLALPKATLKRLDTKL